MIQNSLLTLNISVLLRFRRQFFILVHLILILNPEIIIFTEYKINDESKLIMWSRKTIICYLWNNTSLGK